MAYRFLLARLEDGILHLSLNRPNQLNALTRALRGELVEALREAEDEAVQVVVLSGEGRAFSVGQDVGELEELYQKGEDLERLVADEYEPIVARLLALPKPVVAAVHGFAAGGGMTIALAADIRLATEDAVFLPAFVKVGLAPDSGTTALLAQAVGPAKTREALLTGEPLPADLLHRLGAVKSLYPDREALLAGAFELAQTLRDGARLAQREIKELVALAQRLPFDELVARERAAQGRLARTADHAEGLRALRERRPAAFQGR